MTFHIELRSDIEAVLQERVLAAGLDIETMVVNVLREEVADELAFRSRPKLTHEEFVTRLRVMIERHAISSGHVDDSRESIYAGCGE